MEGKNQKRTQRSDAAAGVEAAPQAAVGEGAATAAPAPVVLFYPFPGKIYTRGEIAEIFGRLGPLDPVVVALRLICQLRFEAAARDAAAQKLTEREAGHAGGRIEEITSFRDEIMGYLRAEDPMAPGRR